MATARRIIVRDSHIHGRGVFARVDIPKDALILEYKGERISWEEALARHPHDPHNPTHTFYFDIDDGYVIDGGRQGNSARWINHSCQPNCHAKQVQVGDHTRVFIYAKRHLRAGEELFYDYGLIIDAKLTKKLRDEYKCLCGARKCRGTLLASTRG